MMPASAVADCTAEGRHAAIVHPVIRRQGL
jgi:hypothetical protein